MEVYLDNSATTRPRKEIIENIAEYSYKYFGNPSSLHRMGLTMEKKINEMRRNISSIINCNEKELYFTSGGTEANNIAIHGIVEKFRNRKAHIICSKIEHASILNIFKYYEKFENIEVDYINVDSNGIIDLEELESSIKEETVLISIMMVNNEIGSIQPIKDISKIIRSKNKNIVFHSDCVQAYGKIDIDIRELDLDMISISSHKIHSIKGSGAVYINNGINIRPLFQGGGQERDIRPGTENTAGIYGLSLASTIMDERKSSERKKIKDMKEYLIAEIEKNIPDIKVNSPLRQENINNILNISIKGIKAEILLHSLEDKGIYISTGSACSSKNKDKSHVLKAIGLIDEEIEGSIRISLSYENSKEEIDFFVKELKESVSFIREIISL